MKWKLSNGWVCGAAFGMLCGVAIGFGAGRLGSSTKEIAAVSLIDHAPSRPPQAPESDDIASKPKSVTSAVSIADTCEQLAASHDSVQFAVEIGRIRDELRYFPVDELRLVDGAATQMRARFSSRDGEMRLRREMQMIYDRARIQLLNLLLQSSIHAGMLIVDSGAGEDEIAEHYLTAIRTFERDALYWCGDSCESSAIESSKRLYIRLVLDAVKNVSPDKMNGLRVASFAFSQVFQEVPERASVLLPKGPAIDSQWEALMFLNSAVSSLREDDDVRAAVIRTVDWIKNKYDASIELQKGIQPLLIQ